MWLTETLAFYFLQNCISSLIQILNSTEKYNATQYKNQKMSVQKKPILNQKMIKNDFFKIFKFYNEFTLKKSLDLR